MAEEVRVAYAERVRESAARAETLPHEIPELNARITHLRECLKAGDPTSWQTNYSAGYRVALRTCIIPNDWYHTE